MGRQKYVRPSGFMQSVILCTSPCDYGTGIRSSVSPGAVGSRNITPDTATP